MCQREPGARRIEVYRGLGCYTHKRVDEHATLDGNVVAPFGFRETLEESFKKVALHQGLRRDARFLCSGVYARLELRCVFGSHGSTSR